MIQFSALAQQLSAEFTPLKQTILLPDITLLQVRNGLPVTEAPLEQTAYIITSNTLTHIAERGGRILYLIIASENESSLCPPPFENYILFPADTDRISLYQKVQHLIKKANRIAYAHYRLSRCLLERASMDKILKVGAELLENPLFLSDTSTRILSWSDYEQLKTVEDELIQCIIKHGFVTSELFDKYNYGTFLPSIEQTEKAFLQKSAHKEKKERLIVKVVINHRYFGWIVAIPQGRPFEDGDCEILDILTNVLSLELERNKIGFALSYRENLLLEILSGRISSLEEFRRRAEGFDWKPGEHFYTMAISFHNENAPTNKERTITAYKNHLALIYPTYKAICIGDILYLLLETSDLGSVVNNLDNFFKTYHLAAGCSRHFSNILDFGENVEQATEILHLGLKLKPEQSVYRYQDFYMPYMISTLEKYSDLQSYCLPEIIALQCYDRKNNTCYMETLQAYLKFRNALTTAEYLHIHRNTMNYRLQKIDEITHLKLNEGDDLYKIWFSCLILKLHPDLKWE